MLIGPATNWALHTALIIFVSVLPVVLGQGLLNYDFIAVRLTKCMQITPKGCSYELVIIGRLYASIGFLFTPLNSFALKDDAAQVKGVVNKVRNSSEYRAVEVPV